MLLPSVRRDTRRQRAKAKGKRGGRRLEEMETLAPLETDVSGSHRVERRRIFAVACGRRNETYARALRQLFRLCPHIIVISNLGFLALQVRRDVAVRDSTLKPFAVSLSHRKFIYIRYILVRRSANMVGR